MKAVLRTYNLPNGTHEDSLIEVGDEYDFSKDPHEQDNCPVIGSNQSILDIEDDISPLDRIKLLVEVEGDTWKQAAGPSWKAWDLKLPDNTELRIIQDSEDEELRVFLFNDKSSLIWSMSFSMTVPDSIIVNTIQKAIEL